METKKKTDLGQLLILLSIIAVVFTVIRWGNVGSFGMPLCSSLGAIVAGIIALVKKMVETEPPLYSVSFYPY